MIHKPLVAASLRPFILSILAAGESYGYEIIHRVQQLTAGEIQYTTSTLYPVLHALENDGLLESFWQEVENAPRRKYYRLTAQGRRALEGEKREWLHVHGALQQLWEPGPSLSPA
jgi:DNA-binding PadR family transcriptional regulator